MIVCDRCEIQHRFLHSVHNRFQWQRYGQHRDLMWSLRNESESKSREEMLQEEWLWHGTSGTDPRVICMGRDGVDFRRVGVMVCVCLGGTCMTWLYMVGSCW